MKTLVNQFVKAVVDGTVSIGRKTRLGEYIENQIINSAMGRVTEVMHGGVNLKFATPNSLCHWRAKTFSTKEPETLEWIESIPEASIFWDVGANVGLYSVYAAKIRNCQVWAFEPSVFNLELLARNIALNALTDKVFIVPIALNDHLGSNRLRMTTTEWGGALSTFGKNFGWDGKKIRQVFEFQTIGLSIDDVIHKLEIPMPEYIKMDVDGIEHLILKGGLNTLHNVKCILIEINDDFHEQAEQCHSLLTEVGLTLKEKRHSIDIAVSTGGFENTYNQIWVRL